MAKYVEMRRHTDADGDVLTPEGVSTAVEIGSHLTGGYDVLVSSGAQRATQTLACFLAGLGENVPHGVVVEPGLRSAAEERWRAAYVRRPGAARFRRSARPIPSSSRKTPRRLRPRCVASSSLSPTAVARSSSATARRTRPPFSVSQARWSSRSRRAAACSSSRRREPSESRSSLREQAPTVALTERQRRPSGRESGSCRLQDTECWTVERMKVVNALCRFAEVADAVPL